MTLANWTTRFLDESVQGDSQPDGQGKSSGGNESEGKPQGKSPQRPAAQSFVGSRVGAYLVTKRLGAGGVGEVFKGIDVMLKREVAIKVLRDDLTSDPIFLERFRQEAQLQAKLSHPNVASVHAFLHDGDKELMVMEYVAGISLDEFIRSGGPVPIERALSIFRRTLDGIDHAHSCGIVHRDIKPANIMLADNGQVKVMDFGIARALDSREHLTRHGEVAGTAKSMSPEQIRGRQADVRSDIYSLGVVLYTLITGRAPFDTGSDFALMRSHLEQSPPPLHTFVENVPAKVEAAVMKALEKDPAARFQTAGEFSRALDLCIAELTTAPLRDSALQDSIYPAAQTPLRANSNAAPHDAQMSARTTLNPALQSNHTSSRTAMNPAVQDAEMSMKTIINPAVQNLQRLKRDDTSLAAKSAEKLRSLAADMRLPKRLDRRVGAVALAVLALVGGATMVWSQLGQDEEQAAAPRTLASTPTVLQMAPSVERVAVALIAPPAPIALPTPIAPPTPISIATAPVHESAPVALAQPAIPAPVVASIAAPLAAPAIPPAMRRTLSITLLPSDDKAADTAAMADPEQTHRFKPGERVRLLVTPSQDAHVYCYLQDETRRILRFYPNRFSKSASVRADAPVQLPGKMPFEIVANTRNVAETVACFASERDVMAKLPAAVVGTDFAKLQATSLEQVRSAFASVAGDTLAEASFRVDLR